MNIAVLQAEAEKVASEVIARFQITALPVCPHAIAAKKHILVQTRDEADTGVSGFLMRVGNNFGIYYASHIQNEGFIRFSVAHELGHYFLPGHPEALFPHGDGLHASRSGFISDDRYERQADLFAAALLMPKTLFLDVVREMPPGFAAIRKLKNRCRTSITATAIRYARFAEDPVAIIVSTGATIDYCLLSSCLADLPGVRRLAKGSFVPRGTCTARFNADARNISSAAEDAAWASLDDWFDDAPQVVMKEDVVGLGGYGKTLTVLFSEEAIDPDDDDDSGWD